MHYLPFVRPHSQLPLNRTRGILSPNFYIFEMAHYLLLLLLFAVYPPLPHSQNPCNFSTSRIFADISRHSCCVKRKRVKT